MSEKQGLPVDNSLRSDNSTGSPKGHSRSLKFFYSSSEVTLTAPSPAPKGFSSIYFPFAKCRKRLMNLKKQSEAGRRGFCDLEESVGAA